MNILDYKTPLTIAGAAFAAISGACWGYVYAEKELSKSFDSRLETLLEIESEKARRYYSAMYKTDSPADLSELPEGEELVIDQQHIIIPKDALATAAGRANVLAQLGDALESEDEEEEAAEPEVELEEVNMLEQADALSFEAMMAERSGDTPYVISKEEFVRNDANFEVFKLAFFEKDGTLIDDNDDIIPDTDATVGDINLQRFGVMSQNNNVVYVQNDASETLFQITRNTSMTAQEALYGIAEDEDATLQHSSMRRRRPRREDE